MEDKLEKLKKKNDLSDIILEKDSSSKLDVKKMLLLAASLVLLFLIVLIGMKMFNNSNISPSENLSGVGESVEQTSDALVDNVKKTVDETSDPLFKKEAIIDENSETDLKFEEMVRKLKKQDALENQDVSVDTADTDLSAIVDTPDKIATATKKTKESVVDKIKEITPQPIKKIVPKSTPKKQEIIRTITPTVVTQPKIITTPQPRVVTTHSTNHYTSTTPISSISGYFIQVGATSKSFPDRRFLQKVKNSGYDYIIHKMIIKGNPIKKVLVGPYNSREEARNDLNNVQTLINPSAYIYRVK